MVQIVRGDFTTWAQTQKPRPLKAQIDHYIVDFVAKGGTPPTRKEVLSFINTMYIRLRRGEKFPTIQYTRQPNRAPRETTEVNYAEGRELQAFDQVIDRNGFGSLDTMNDIRNLRSSLENAPRKLVDTTTTVVKSMSAEIEKRDVKLENKDVLLRYQEQTSADLRAQLADSRRNTAFAQEQAMLLLRRRKDDDGPGNDVV